MIAARRPIAACSPTILVVEDEVLVRMLVVESLREESYTVLEASSSDEAMECLAGGDVDLVFSDVRMPGAMNGIELAEWIAAEYPQLPILLTSGYVGSASGHIQPLPDLPFIGKPYNITEVVKLIERTLEKA